MKSKKALVLTTIVILLLICTAAAASLGVFEPEQQSEFTASEQAVAEISYSSVMAQNMKDNASAISDVAAGYDMDALSYEDYISIESYITFMLKHSLTADEISAVNALVANGTTMQTIEQIYDFYLTTNDDFSVVTQIANLEEEFWGNHWIENAYNHITNNSHGVLDSDDVKSYLETFSADEISYANVMSRKGVYTIQEILNKVQGGSSWDDITSEIYSSVLTTEKLSGSALERTNAAIAMKSANIEYSSDPMLAYEFAQAVSKADADAISVNEESSEQSTEQLKETYYDNLANASNTVLKKLGMATSYMNYEEYEAYYEANYNLAIENGLMEAHIRLLEKRGYTMGEIASVSSKFNGKILDLVSVLKSERRSDV